ncbi:hypothetical protein T484DRAFT_1905656 [Baffinella frigidus]|nr:hypothetical protein T484DRAFT_1905656 [Cryptophyta sp. CCMP2293]
MTEAGEDMQPLIKEGTDEVSKLGNDIEHFKVTAKHLNQIRETTQNDLGLNGIRSDGSARAGQLDLKTDQQIASEIGDHRMYMPGYITAVVGHGLAAPGYIAALVALLALANVFRSMDLLLLDKPSIPRAPLAPTTGRPAAAVMAPLVACFAIEALHQAWWSSVETIVSPITGIYLGYTIDATAVFMMGIAATGMVGLALSEGLLHPVGLSAVEVGLALSEGLLTATTPRALVLVGCFIVVGGLLCCIPWNGNLSATAYVFGSYACALGFFPLSNLALQAEID